MIYFREEKRFMRLFDKVTPFIMKSMLFFVKWMEKILVGVRRYKSTKEKGSNVASLHEKEDECKRK
jgi:hypothetical protein